MKASALEFRFRLLLHALVFGLGLWSPWNLLLHAGAAGANAHTWGLLSALLAERGILPIATAFDLLLALGILFAFAAAALRTWGSAYLGADVVFAGTMHAEVLADGPFRHLRNPLYLGTFLHSFALALLMPASGAVFTLILIAWMQLRLILGEEDFLARSLGAPYRAYCALVPRLLPALKPRVQPSGRPPRWGQAFLGEIYMWGVAGSFAFAGWRYNASLLIQCAIVSLGASIVIRALRPQPVASPQT